MRARYPVAAFLILAAACSRPAADPAVEADARDEDPDLALTAPDGVPVVSGIEVHRQEPERQHEHGTPAVSEDSEESPAPEPRTIAEYGDRTPAPLSAVPAEPGRSTHVHPRADETPTAVAAVDESEREPGADAGGGGKPTGVSTGLGPVPDRGWGDPAIIDDPDPLAGSIPGIGIGTGIGRGGAVIIRGGAGGVDDDCAIHPRGGVAAVPTSGPGALVNDRDPRRGALINERAPRGAQRPSLPRGGGFPRGGGIR